MIRVVAAAIAVMVALGGLTGPAAATESATGTAHTPAQYQRDWDGDGHSDVLGVAADGDLYLYPGNGRGGFTKSRKVGHNWSAFDQITQFGAIERNALLDIVGIQDGVLWGYGSDGRGGFKGGRALGPGWGAFRMLTAPGDWTGDGHDDLMAVRSDDDTLWMWPGNGRGGLGSGREIGVGWQSTTALIGAGHFDGDYLNDLMARQNYTNLWLHPGDGYGGFNSPVGNFQGWGGLTALVGTGDFDGDRRSDLIGRAEDGRIILYRGNGVGGFYGGSAQIGHGWSKTRILGDNAETKAQYCDRTGWC